MADLKSVFQKIRDAAEDLVSLDVVTLTGEVDVQGTNNEVDLKELYKTIQANAISKSNVSLVAYTHLDLDSDAVLFVKSGLSEGEKPLVEAHNEMVIASAVPHRRGGPAGWLRLAIKVVGLLRRLFSRRAMAA